jgi:putative Mg2+ transporter-C (MgtC) family protein
MTWMEFVIRLMTAFCLGSAIGLERQWRQRMAGLRTNTLVATGAALFVMISVMTPGDSSPTRIVAQVVSGIGFLGGGVILREGLTVRGLNTAATLWCAAAIGSLAGAGLVFHGVAGTIAVLGANVLLRPLGYHINQQPLKDMDTEAELELCYRFDFICRTQDEIHIRTLLHQVVRNGRLKLRSLSIGDLKDTPDRVSVAAELIARERDDAFLEQIIDRLSLEPGVFTMNWRIIEEIGEEVWLKV